jgi:ribulose-phosphate 3-epimerase
MRCIEIAGRTRAYRLRVGIAINPETPIDTAFLECIRAVNPDLVLVMTVEPGKGGQPLIEACIEKVRVLHAYLPDLCIQVDGGITEKNATLAIDAGATVIVAGTLLFTALDPAATIAHIKGPSIFPSASPS